MGRCFPVKIFLEDIPQPITIEPFVPQKRAKLGEPGVAPSAGPREKLENVPAYVRSTIEIPAMSARFVPFSPEVSWGPTRAAHSQLVIEDHPDKGPEVLVLHSLCPTIEGAPYCLVINPHCREEVIHKGSLNGQASLVVPETRGEGVGALGGESLTRKRRVTAGLS